MNKAQAGSLGGRATAAKYGADYMRTIARKGGIALHQKYRMEPVGVNDFILVKIADGSTTGKTIHGRRINE